MTNEMEVLESATTDLVDNYLDFICVDKNKSFKGWLTHLTNKDFSDIRKSFEEMDAQMFLLVLARMTGKHAEKGDLFVFERYLENRLISDVDVAEIGLYRKGYLDLVERTPDGCWIFTPSELGDKYVKELEKSKV